MRIFLVNWDMMKTNLFKSASILTDGLIFLHGKRYVLSPRGSNILLFSLIKEIQRKHKINFLVYQPGDRNCEITFKGITIRTIKSEDFNDYKKKLNHIDFNTDIIHYNNIDLFEKRFKDIFTTATVHTNAFLEKENAKKWLKETVGNIDEVVVVNTKYLDEFKSVRLIKNGISQNIFQYDSSKRKTIPQIDILFPNLNTPKKNREFAIDLIRELDREGRYKFRLLLTGDREELNLRKDLYKFVGQKTYGKQMNTLYRKSFITIIPSVSESCSLCALESMSSGTPVIANDIYGISDYITNNFNGYILSVKNIKAWICKIYTLIEDRIEYTRIQQNARNTVIKEYNLERMSNEYYLMWLKLFEKGNG